MRNFVTLGTFDDSFAYIQSYKENSNLMVSERFTILTATWKLNVR